MTTISIITVTYNSASTLSTAIESVIGQTYPHIEYIVVDGKSSDQTAELVASYGTKISKFISEPDSGIYNAMNKGLKLATGDYIGFLHADDILATPTIVEQMVHMIDAEHPDVLYGNLAYVAKDNINQTIRFWETQDFEPRLLKQGWMPPHPTLYVKNRLYQQLKGYNETYRIAADYELILRLFTIPQLKCTNLKTVMVKMRVGGASNKSVKNLLQKSSEDLRAMRTNNVGGAFTLIYKNLSKIPQFFKRSKK
jgi:glycosyltransferase